MLALVGSGEYLPSIESVDRELLNRIKAPVKVFCLPTAAGTEGAERIDYWSNLGVNHFKRIGAEVESLPVINRASANDPMLAERLATGNFIYFSGGKPDYLYDTLKESLVWNAVQTVLAAGGLMAGCSAGAMIMGEKFFGFPGWHAGFNFLPGITVVPHYDEIPQAMVGTIRLMFARELTLVGVEGNTALIQNGSGYEVLGAGGVTVWNQAHKTRFTQGPLPAGIL